MKEKIRIKNNTNMKKMKEKINTLSGEANNSGGNLGK